MKKHLSLYLLILLLLPQLSCDWQGKVVGVTDGDTITVMNNGKGENIRLYGVDCPEKRQAFGTKAKQFTSDMVFGEVVEVERIDTDRYGRTVGVVRVNGKCLNEELIKNGLAWLYYQYCNKPICDTWYRYQEEARQKKLGLWSIPNPVPPWEFRHDKRSHNSAPIGIYNTSSYHGNTATSIFHRSGCKFYNCKDCTAVFNSREKAITAGYRPCGSCRP